MEITAESVPEIGRILTVASEFRLVRPVPVATRAAEDGDISLRLL